MSGDFKSDLTQRTRRSAEENRIGEPHPTLKCGANIHCASGARDLGCIDASVTPRVAPRDIVEGAGNSRSFPFATLRVRMTPIMWE